MGEGGGEFYAVANEVKSNITTGSRRAYALE
jgi:hypothetical protein